MSDAKPVSFRIDTPETRAIVERAAKLSADIAALTVELEGAKKALRAIAEKEMGDRGTKAVFPSDAGDASVVQVGSTKCEADPETIRDDEKVSPLTFSKLFTQKWVLNCEEFRKLKGDEFKSVSKFFSTEIQTFRVTIPKL